MNTNINMDARDTFCFFAGMGLGAGLAYILDPQMGRRRRAIARDKAYSYLRGAREGMQAFSQDLSNRTAGMMHDARAMWQDEGPVSDEKLRERVRSCLGRVVSHPSAIRTDVYNGYVTLSGPILAHEVDNLLSAVNRVPGVQGVHERLSIHRSPSNISALQGRSRPKGGSSFNLFEENWSPATRGLVALVGGGLLAFGLSQKAPTACFLGTLGLGLLASGVSNTGMRDMLPESMMHPERFFSSESSEEMQHYGQDAMEHARAMAGV